MKKEYKPFEKFNIVGSISTNSLFALVLLFTSGGLFQGIWMHCGFNDFQIGLITSLTSLAQCLAMVASLWFADSVKKPVKIMGYCLFPGALYFAYLGVTFLLGGVPPFWAACLFVMIFFLSYGLHGSFSYKCPELLYSVERYGRVTSLVGIIGQLLCLAPTTFIPVWLAGGNYENVMGLLLMICAFFVVASSVTILFYHPLREVVPKKKTSGNGQLGKLWRDKSVRSLFFPNLTRGLSMGVIGCLPMLCTHVLPMDKTEVSGLSTYIVIATIIGSVIPIIFASVKQTKVLSVFASAGLLLGSCLLVLMKNVLALSLVFLVIEVFYAAVNIAVPVLVVHYVPFEILGGYTAIRMGATMAGSALSSALLGAILLAYPGKFTAFLILAAGGLLQLYTGLSYGLYKTEKNVCEVKEN